MVINVDLDNKFWGLRKRPIVLLTLFRTLLRCSSNVNLTSNVTPRCFWEEVCKTLLLLKTKDGCGSFFILWLKITSWACLLGSGLKLIFHWKAHLLIFFRSSFNSLAENNDVSSATKFYKSSAKSLILIQNNSGPSIDPCGTPTLTLVEDEFCPLRTTLCFLLLKKSDKICNRSPKILFCFNLKISPSCPTLLKALDISKKHLF